MPRHLARLPLFLYGLAGSLLLGASVASAKPDVDPRIVCEAETFDQTQYLSLRPENDPFEREVRHFNNRQRVAAQWLQNPDRLRTFVYDASKKRAVLIGTHTVPVQSSACGSMLIDMKMYMSSLEMELNLSCRLVCGE